MIIFAYNATDNILWLSVANIEERGDTQEPLDLTDIVGSNQCAGGVVTNTVGGAQLDNTGHCHDMQVNHYDFSFYRVICESIESIYCLYTKINIVFFYFVHSFVIEL